MQILQYSIVLQYASITLIRNAVLDVFCAVGSVEFDSPVVLFVPFFCISSKSISWLSPQASSPHLYLHWLESVPLSGSHLRKLWPALPVGPMVMRTKEGRDLLALVCRWLISMSAADNAILPNFGPTSRELGARTACMTSSNILINHKGLTRLKFNFCKVCCNLICCSSLGSVRFFYLFLRLIEAVSTVFDQKNIKIIYFFV